MLISAEHEIFSANEYENANNSAFSYLLAEKFSCSAMFSKKEIATVSNLRFISRTKFMLSGVEHERNFITSGPGLEVMKLSSCSYQLSMKFFLLINLKLLTTANSFLLNLAEHENFSASKYENALLLAFSYLSVEKISCSAELSMKV